MAIREQGSVDRNQHLTFKANLGVGRHGWLRLTPAYGVKVVRERVSRLPPGSVVTDPFSGTGTTPLGAAELGHIGQSVDINPFLVWLGRVKTSHYPAELCAAAVAGGENLGEAARELAGCGAVDLWQPALHRIERWWSPGVLDGLRALRHCIDRCEADRGMKDLWEIALCRTLIACSNAAFNHQSMSFKAASPQPSRSGADEARNTVTRFVSEVADLAASAEHPLPGVARIVQGDSRNMMRELQPCDLLLTSPPYVNRMSYIRELRPYMYWLRHLDAPADAGDLDWQAIGGTWGTATSKLNSWRPLTTVPMSGDVDDVCARICRDGGRNGPLLSAYVGKYFHDMWLHFQAAFEHVKPGGAVSYIIGNSSFYGHVVPAEQWFAGMLRALEFEQVSVRTIRKRNSNRALFEYDVSAVRPA